MKTSSALIMVGGLAAALQAASAADITGTVILKGTPPKEKDITPVMEDANGKLLGYDPETITSLTNLLVTAAGGRAVSGQRAGQRASSPAIVPLSRACTAAAGSGPAAAGGRRGPPGGGGV